MYAINHAATALLLKKKFPTTSMVLLLVAVQLVELLWVLLNYFNIEHFSVSNGKLSLDFLPYSHSVFSGVILAILSYAFVAGVYKNKPLAIAFAIGVLSHVFLDVFFHEKDIRLSPFSAKPAWGFGIINFPWINFIIELLYGFFCWWYFKGDKKLLWAIVLFNFVNLPVMLASPDFINILGEFRSILPSFILFQILITWYMVWRYSNVASQNISPRSKDVGVRKD